MKRIGTLLCFFVASIIAFTSNVACNRDIVTIRYNLLNLPDSIAFAGGKHITNLYDASGRKWQTDNTTFLGIEMMPVVVNGTLATRPVLLREGSGTLYADGIDYEYEYRYDQNTGKSPLTLTKTRIHDPEGYVAEGDRYYYYRRDHLGNVREVWKPSGDSTLTVQRTRYYPSGLPWEYQAGDSASLQPYKFNGCEFIETHGYDVTDLGNRGVYHAINRFTTMDRFAEKYPWQSPYVHAGNNPVNFVDVGGDFPAFVVPLIKGVAGAVVDAAAQVSVSMANGNNFGQSLSNIDYTSVGASFLTSALAGPGMSTWAKIGMGIATTTDALVDVKANGEVETIGGIVGESKPMGKIAVDAVSSVVPGKAANELASGLNKAISSDLSSSAAATMTKEIRSELVNAQKNINSLSGEIIRESTANFTGGLIGGQANEMFESTSTNLPPSLPANSIIQQNDATRIQQNYYEIKIKNPW